MVILLVALMEQAPQWGWVLWGLNCCARSFSPMSPWPPPPPPTHTPPKASLLKFGEGAAWNQWILSNSSLQQHWAKKLNCNRSVVRRGLNVMLFLLISSGIWSLKSNVAFSSFFFFNKTFSSIPLRYFPFKEMRDLPPRKLHLDSVSLRSLQGLGGLLVKIFISPSPPLGHGSDHFHVLSCGWKENEQKCKAWLMKQEQAEGDLSSC